jgi:hypothetical protein
LKREIELITAHKQQLAAEWVHSPRNKPFKHSSDVDLGADELLTKNPDDMYAILQKNARVNYAIEKMKQKRN